MFILYLSKVQTIYMNALKNYLIDIHLNWELIVFSLCQRIQIYTIAALKIT